MDENIFYLIPKEDDLAHHGIKGMKWGVRRYQNYDGSYTKKGLERYKKSEEAYNKANEKYKEAKKSGTKQEIREARASRKRAKKTLESDYDRLKNDKRADEGKKLYQSGKTITSNNQTLQGLSMAIPVATALGRSAAIRTGKSYCTKFGNVSAADIVIFAGIGAEAAVGLLSVKKESENRKLRAYYAH